jgi:hypothetical protein
MLLATLANSSPRGSAAIRPVRVILDRERAIDGFATTGNPARMALDIPVAMQEEFDP